MKTYKTIGYVLGKYWGGGYGAYKATTITANTRKEILEEAEKKLKNGSLDSGMGFESLIGAILEIEKIETIIIDGKDFHHKEYDSEFIGDLTRKQKKFLAECAGLM